LIKGTSFLKLSTAMDSNDLQKTRTTSYAVIAIVAALALLGVVVLTVTVAIPLQQQAEALGCPDRAPAFNASKGRCLRG
jgi:hypothetical protein